MATLDTSENKSTTLVAPSSEVANWTVDDIKKSDILVFREDQSQYVDTVVAPNGLQVGLLDKNFLTDLLVTGHITGSGIIYSELGFSGSLQTLCNGTNYLQGSGGISITNNADGSITIAGSGGGSSSRTKTVYSSAVTSGQPFAATGLFFNSYEYSQNLIDVFHNGELLVSGAVGDVSADFALGTDTASGGVIYFQFSTTTNDEITVIVGSSSGGGGGGGSTYVASTGLSLTGTAFSANTDGTTIRTNSSDNLEVLRVPNSLGVGNGLQGGSYDGSTSKTISVKPVTGSPVTVSGAGVDFSMNPISAVALANTDEVMVTKGGALGKITIGDIISAAGGSSGVAGAAYLVAAASSDLSNERVLSGGGGIQVIDDSGAGTFQVSALLESAGGLEIISGKIAVKVADFAGSGLSASGGDLIVNVSSFAGTGLSESGGTLNVDYGSGSNQSAMGSNTITVTAGDGLDTGGTVSIGNSSNTISLNVLSTDISGLGTSVSNNNLDVYLSGTNGIQVLTGSEGELVIDGTASAYIGAAEDGDYTDGLYTDFTPTTPTGTAIDRFNELFKYLVPKSAPILSSVGLDTAVGVTSLLSFGASSTVSGVSNVSALDDHPAIDVNGNYTSETSSNGHDRAGVYGTAIELVGDLADTVVADLTTNSDTNYPIKSFGKGNLGTLTLELNGTNVKTIDLTDASVGSGVAGSGTDSELTSGTGFFELSAASDGKYNSGDSYSLEKHRTGKWKIAAGSQRAGWNYMRVKHTIGAAVNSSNYIQWIVDPVASNGEITVDSPSISGLSLTGSKYISGVKYYTGGTATYTATVNNFYTNVYAISNIVLDSLEIAPVTVTPTTINTSGGEDESKSIPLSKTVTIDSTSILNASLNVSVSVAHPTKSNVEDEGAASITNILAYNIAEASSSTLKTVENMDGESYRLENASYSTQSDVTSGAFDSTVSLASNNGLQVWNRRLVAPIQSTNGGNYSTIVRGPAGNPDYSSLTTGTKTYFRKFTNTKGGSSSNFTLEIDGTGTIVDNTTSLSGNKLQIFMKVPGSGTNVTGWMDLSTSFATGAYGDNDGCYVETFDSSLNSSILFTSGIKFIENNNHIVIKIVADGSWTGHVDELRFTWR
jgi:hypothetical protein